MKTVIITKGRGVSAATTGGVKTATVVAAANLHRKSITIQNADTAIMYLHLGATDPAVTTNACIVLAAASGADDGTGGSVTLDGYVGPITTNASPSYRVAEFE